MVRHAHQERIKKPARPELVEGLVFTAPIKLRGINPYVLVSAARARKLKPNWRKPMPVRVRVNDKPKEGWRINMMPTGEGAFYLYLHGEVREASGTKVRDRVRIDLTFDDKYTSGPVVTPWFKRALRKNPKAKAGWNALTPSRQKEIVRYLSNLKSTEARVRNLEKVMRNLSGPSPMSR